LVLHDELELGLIYIQTYLHKLSSIPGWSWVARALPRNKHLVEPPNADWRQMILSQGELVLGDVRFIAEPYDFKKFDGGSDPVILWINITGIPPDLWEKEEFRRIAMELESFFVDVDSRSWEHIDLTILRLKVGVKSKEVVVPCRNMLFVDDTGHHKYFDLQFQVEDDQAFNRTRQY
jgi:Domain of unknown function (DUF4283)